eukprot:scaffold964_cov261-Pinguiococcus_pyrenoidosus.AAC.5
MFRQCLGRWAARRSLLRRLRVVVKRQDEKLVDVYEEAAKGTGFSVQRLCEGETADVGGSRLSSTQGLLNRYILRHFLPQGYPESVRPEYTAYVVPQCISYIAGRSACLRTRLASKDKQRLG